MARLKNSTVSPFDNVPAEGRHIVFDRITKDWYGFYDGNFVKAGDRNEVEEGINERAYTTAKLAGWAVGFREALATA